MRGSPTRLGILCLVAGLAVFSVQDLILKLISGDYPLYQAMLVRGLVSAPLLLMLAHVDGGVAALFSAGLARMIRRGLVMFVAYFSFYIALAGLPLPTTVALYFSNPLFITILSVILLGERVSPLAWLAVIAGFLGVLIILRPGSALFDWAALLPVLSGFTYALAMVSARAMGGAETAPALAFWGNAVFLILAAMLAAVFHDGRFAQDGHPSLGFLTRGWVTPDRTDLGLMIACGVIAAFGLWLLTQAYRLAAASTVAPFEYTGLIWSIVWGWIFWRDWPDALGWLGITIIAGSGLAVWAARRGERANERPPKGAASGTGKAR